MHIHQLILINIFRIIIKIYLHLKRKFHILSSSFVFYIILFFSFLHSSPIKEEIIDNSSTTSQLVSIFTEPIPPCLLSISLPNSPPDNRRISIRQQKRRTFRDLKDLSISTKKKPRLDIDINSNFNIDNINNSDNSPIPLEHQQSVESIMKYFFFRINFQIFLFFYLKLNDIEQ